MLFNPKIYEFEIDGRKCSFETGKLALKSQSAIIARMGDTFSINLGLNRKKIVSIGLVIVTMITSTIVVTIGSIPFIGLIVPNIVSIYKGDNMKKSLFYLIFFFYNFIPIF